MFEDTDEAVPSAETKKQFKKETVKGGYSNDRRRSSGSGSGSDINYMDVAGKVGGGEGGGAWLAAGPQA